MESTNLRIIPLKNKEGESILKNKNIDYQIYEMLQVKSYLTNDKIRFCYRSEITQLGLYREYKANCADNHLRAIGKDAFIRHFKNLFYAHLVVEGYVVDMYGKTVKAYILPQDYKIFQLVPLETMRFLTNATSDSTIRIYGYLLNQGRLRENYKFTYKELVEHALGKQPQVSGSEQIVKDCLELLVRCGFIEYEEVYDVVNGHAVPKKVLIKINIERKKMKIRRKSK